MDNKETGRSSPMQARVSYNTYKSGPYTQDEMIRCAWLYYMQDQTQEEVARELGVSRARVVRLLKEARAQGLVQIKINAPVGRLSLANQVRSLYRQHGLTRVHLVPTIEDEVEQKIALAHEFPSVFSPQENDIIAVSWGTTLSYAIDFLPEQNIHASKKGLTEDIPRPIVVSVFGGIQGGIHTANPYDIAFRLGQKLHANVYTIQAPAFVRDQEMSTMLLREESVQKTLSIGMRARIALFGVGDVKEHSTIERINVISREEREWLASEGAVGDLLGHFLNREGEIIDLDGKLMAVSLPLADLLHIPERICLGGGPAKHEMILAMLRGGYITTLITDEATAEYLIAARPPTTGEFQDIATAPVHKRKKVEYASEND